MKFSLGIRSEMLDLAFYRPLGDDVKTINLENNFKVPTFNRAIN